MISVIIPAYNEEHCLPLLLRAIASQYKSIRNGIEVVVVDNNSSDNTKQLVQQFISNNPNMSVKLVEETRPGVTFARNTGARHASGTMLVFLDADNLIERDFLSEIYKKSFVESYQAGTILCLPDSNTMVGQFVFRCLELIKTTFVGRPFGKNFCRKDVFETVGGYDTTLSLGTNLEFLTRVRLHLKQQGEKMGHVTKPVYVSMRRFERYGYAPILAKWFLAYIGIGRRRIRYGRLI
jgi:glycosyltransferase involved in cell wall biosynthesis